MRLIQDKIIKQALSFTKTKKVLWSLGLFLIWGNVFIYFLITTFSPKDQQQQNNVAQDLTQLVMTKGSTVIMSGAIIIIAAIIFWLMYLVSRASLMVIVDKSIAREPIEFWKTVKQGRKFIPQLAAIWAVTFGTIFLALFLLSAPIGHLWNAQATTQATTLGITGLLIFAPIYFLLSTVNTFAGLLVVLHKVTVRNSIRVSVDLIGKIWPILVRLAILLLMLSILSMIGIIIIQAIILIPFVILSGLPYDMVGFSLNSPVILSGIFTGFLVFLGLTAVVSTLQHICWILIFLELVKPKKFEDQPQPETVPEVV